VVGRSHLSIGEVLSLLQDEFPDVTISKIRFLESQGLVDPERTPSGYRKFYDTDIERLRWVLRQQRDAFLPLKVIKGRLEDQPEQACDEADAELENESLMEELAAAQAIAEESPGMAGPDGAGPDRAGTGADDLEGGPGAEGEYIRGGPDAQLFDAGPPYGRYGEPGGPEDRPGLHRRAPALPREATRNAVARPAAKQQRRPNGAEPARKEAPPAARRASGARSVAPELGGEARDDGDEPELTLEELLEETGADVAAVRELEGFGLITPKVMGGSNYYTRDAAIVTRLASAFARHGVEARHLRAYKGAADREAGLVEQVIMPLIRQRNPEARQAAVRAVEELSNLGGELRAVLLRSALSDLH
jgi:DNA-binding transcriptional MerR regulator